MRLPHSRPVRFVPLHGLCTPTGGRVVCIGMLAAFAGLAASAGTRFCSTFDEPAHLVAGYAMLTRSDYRLDTMHGNLSQRLAALPLLVSRPTFDPRRMPKAAEHWDLAENFFYTSGNDPDRLLLAGRIPIVAVTVALGVLVYGWSSAIFGPAGGLVSLAVVLFHPLVLAHGGLVTSDATVSLMFLAAVGGLWGLLQRADVGRLALSILCVGLLLTAKMSAVLIVPMATLLAAGRVIDGRPWPFHLGRSGVVTSRLGIFAACVGLAVIHAVGVVAIIWASYGFRFSAAGPLPGLPELEWQSLLARRDWKMSLIGLARDARLLPEAYLHGLATAFAAVDISPAFLDGRFFLHGSPWYFPLAFIYKTPPTFWLVAVLALLAAGRSLVVAGDRREAIRAATYDRWPLYVILAIYGVVAVRTHFNIGLRHVMPMLPPLAILMGQAAAWRLPGHAWSQAVPAVAAALLAIEGAAAWPHYIAYFSPLVGGTREGYRHLVDSNLDWGQDLPALRRRLDERGINGPNTYLAYFGTAIPEHYGIRCNVLAGYGPRTEETLPPVSWSGGTYCVSASLLQGVCLLEAHGPWTADRERAYQALTADVEHVVASRTATDTDQGLNSQTLQPKLELLYGMRLARLCAYLRRRKPSETIGGSILVYELTVDDLDNALFQELPPPGSPDILP